jgi:hypothetical protein
LLLIDQITKWFYGVLTRPVQTLNEIAREKPANAAFLVYLGITMLSVLASVFHEQSFQAFQNLMLEANLNIPVSVIIAASLLIAIISIFVITGVLHLLARLFKGNGGFWNLFSAYAFAGVPLIIGVPVTLISGFLGSVGDLLAGLLSFGLSIWTLVLQVIAVRESYNLSTVASIGVYILHLLILVGIPVLVVLGMIIAYATY